MKPLTLNGLPRMGESPPVRGAWIETVVKISTDLFCASSPPVRGAWIETAGS